MRGQMVGRRQEGDPYVALLAAVCRRAARDLHMASYAADARDFLRYVGLSDADVDALSVRRRS